MKKLLGLFLVFFVGLNGWGQSVIFSENMGTTTSTKSIVLNTFQNSGLLTYSGTGDVRNSTISTGYSGASGVANVFITNSTGTNFEISGINTLNYSNLILSFGKL